MTAANCNVESSARLGGKKTQIDDQHKASLLAKVTDLRLGELHQHLGCRLFHGHLVQDGGAVVGDDHLAISLGHLQVRSTWAKLFIKREMAKEEQALQGAGRLG